MYKLEKKLTQISLAFMHASSNPQKLRIGRDSLRQTIAMRQKSASTYSQYGRFVFLFFFVLIFFQLRFHLGTTSQKNRRILDFVQITSPSPRFRQFVQLFLNAKNDDLSAIQNDSLS